MLSDESTEFSDLYQPSEDNCHFGNFCFDMSWYSLAGVQGLGLVRLCVPATDKESRPESWRGCCGQVRLIVNTVRRSVLAASGSILEEVRLRLSGLEHDGRLIRDVTGTP